MQKSIRILRIALPIAFIGFIGFIALNWKKSHVSRDAHPNAEPIAATRPGERPFSQAKEFEDTQTVNGKVVAHIKARVLVAYSSNWNTLEDVAMTIYRPNGKTYDLVCPTAQFNSQTKEAEAKGGVRVTSNDGLDIRTAEIHYDGTHLTNHIPVQFTVDRWTGTAGALDLSVPDESLHLFEKIDATMTPAHPDEDPMTMKGDDGVFRRRENDVTFTNHVVMTKRDDVLNADKMVGKFTQDRKSIIGLEGTGHVDIVLAKSSSISAANAEGRKQITCDKFFSELAPNGVINVLNLVMDNDAGRVHAVIDGPPHRDIVAKTLRIGMLNKAVSDIKAEWSVVMKELGETPRDVTADRVNVYFDPNSHRASAAAMDGNVRYKDPRNEAAAMRMNFDIPADRLILTADQGFDPTVTTDGNIVKAKQIEFSPKGQTARAQGEVIAQLTSKKNGPSADSTNVFPAKGPVFVNADQLNVRQATKTAIFSGNVRAWQEQNTMFAQELQVQGSGDSLAARGAVRTILYNSSSPDPAVRRTPIKTSSDQLFGRKNDRRLDLTGNVNIDDGQRTMNGEKAIFFFDNARKVERIDAEQKVVLVERPTSRKITGDRATYLVNKRMIYIDGSPANVTAPNGNFSGEKIAVDVNRNKVEVLGPTTETKGTYKPPSQ